MKNAMQLKAIMKKLAKENQISAQLVLQNYNPPQPLQGNGQLPPRTDLHLDSSTRTSE